MNTHAIRLRPGVTKRQIANARRRFGRQSPWASVFFRELLEAAKDFDDDGEQWTESPRIIDAFRAHAADVVEVVDLGRDMSDDCPF